VSSLTPDSPSLNIALLERLRRARGNHIPLSELEIDHPRARDDLDALEGFGFQIERHPYLGVSYRGPAARLCPDQIEYQLGTRWIGRRIAVWNRVGSTNDLAARAASTVANDGLVILAEEQTAGRGQRGRSWSAPARSSILMSILLFPPPQLVPLGLEAPLGCAWLIALAAVATAELVSSHTGADARIKWPNDVRVEARKIAGILVERALVVHGTDERGRSTGQSQGIVIGIGLNVNTASETLPEELRDRVTSIAALSGETRLDRSDLAADLIRRLDRWYDEGRTRGVAALNARWNERSEHLGQRVRIVTPDGPHEGRLRTLDLIEGLTLAPDAEPAVSPGDPDSRPASIPPRRIELRDVLSLESLEPLGSSLRPIGGIELAKAQESGPDLPRRIVLEPD
jgi:BirA family biotin operon repressor/biotin-[acetyl-CoA-carboxylase] ligase